MSKMSPKLMKMTKQYRIATIMTALYGEEPNINFKRAMALRLGISPQTVTHYLKQIEGMGRCKCCGQVLLPFFASMNDNDD